MSHGLPSSIEVDAAPALSGPIVGALEKLLDRLNRLIMILAQIALVAASLVLTYSVAARYFLKIATYWQDEAAVFLLVGATFMSSAYVQSKRGHIGIEALTGLLSPSVNRVRLIVVDLASFLFCAFFAWKSWTLAEEAYVDGQISDSTWGPPLVIPYGIMAVGMTLLAIQIAVQVVVGLAGKAGQRA